VALRHIALRRDPGTIAGAIRFARMEVSMRLFWCALCLLALTTLGGCVNSYNDFVYPGKLYDPGTQ
jgi:hypothetical protein